MMSTFQDTALNQKKGAPSICSRVGIHRTWRTSKWGTTFVPEGSQQLLPKIGRWQLIRIV